MRHEVFGKPEGLPARLARWVDRMKTDKAMPWLGLGLLYDLEAVLKLLSLREFGDWLRTHDNPELAAWGAPVLAAAEDSDNLGELHETIDDAAQMEVGEHYDDAVNRLGDEAKELANVRAELVRLGVLADDDKETRPSQLLGLLFQ